MTPRPNICARCGCPLSMEEEDAAQDRGEGLLDQTCLECFCDKQDNDFAGAAIDDPSNGSRGTEVKSAAGAVTANPASPRTNSSPGSGALTFAPDESGPGSLLKL